MKNITVDTGRYVITDKDIQKYVHEDKKNAERITDLCLFKQNYMRVNFLGHKSKTLTN